jgi:putative tryptophan/tyrosine transport system substrate-binding protein
MRRREFIAGLGGAVAWPLAARAQRANEVKRIGWLSAGVENDPQMASSHEAFRAELQRLGWTRGRNLQIDHRWGTAGDEERLRASAASLLASACDVILVNSTLATAILKRLTSTIPIVFVNVADPVASGFVASFARPGGNITGFTSVEFSFAGKWLSLLKDIAPGITRIMMLFNPTNPNWTGYLSTIEAGARTLGMNVTAGRFATADEIERAIETFAREPGGGMIVPPSGTSDHRERIAALAVKYRLPAVYAYDYFAESGGLMSYGSHTGDVYRRAAVYVDRILKGETPADLPVQTPVKFELVINLKTAKALGLTVPQSILLSADEVIE